jgi:hypothetical protein
MIAYPESSILVHTIVEHGISGADYNGYLLIGADRFYVPVYPCRFLTTNTRRG